MNHEKAGWLMTFFSILYLVVIFFWWLFFMENIVDFLNFIFVENIQTISVFLTAAATVAIALYTKKLTEANKINKELLAIEKEYRELDKLIKFFELFLIRYEATITKKIEEKIIDYANNNTSNNHNILYLKYKDIETLIAIFGEIINGTPKNSSSIMSMFDNKTFTIMTYIFLQRNKTIKNKEFIIKKLNLNEKKNILSKEEKYKTPDIRLLTKLINYNNYNDYNDYNNYYNLHNLYYFIRLKIVEDKNATS